MIVENFQNLLINFRFAKKTAYFMSRTDLIEQFKDLSQRQND